MLGQWDLSPMPKFPHAFTSPSRLSQSTKPPGSSCPSSKVEYSVPGHVLCFVCLVWFVLECVFVCVWGARAHVRVCCRSVDLRVTVDGMINTMTKSNLWKKGLYWLVPYGLLSLHFYKTQDHKPRAVATVGWHLPHQPLIKKMLYILAYSRILRRHVLSGGSFLSDDFRLCQVSVKPASIGA